MMTVIHILEDECDEVYQDIHFPESGNRDVDRAYVLQAQEQQYI